jgi:predicted acetyltransferase
MPSLGAPQTRKGNLGGSTELLLSFAVSDDVFATLEQVDLELCRNPDGFDKAVSSPLPFMLPLNLVISKIGPDSDTLLRNLFEHYCHDMSEWFEIDTGADGRYAHDTSSVWRDGHDVYLARVGDSIAGFALIGSGNEWVGEIGAHDVHEFFIMRRFRRRGVGQSMTTFLWNEHLGEWLVRVLEANTPALLFWRNAISRYSVGSYREEQRIVNGRPWR